MSNTRLKQLSAWVASQLQVGAVDLVPLAADASFRRYFRVTAQGRPLIVMDAPPPQEDCGPFVAVQTLLSRHGVRVPALVVADLTQGFVILEDLGSTLLAQVINPDNATALYSQAMNQLVQLQRIPRADVALPRYDAERLLSEMRLFDQWFLPKLMHINPSADEASLLDAVYRLLITNALDQPQVLVHRDFHARNLMVLDQENALGVIDFQDAVVGPVSYDLVSLLRDAYVQWPDAQVRQWVHLYWQRAQVTGAMPGVAEATLQRWFDQMGAQRHLKILGIFVRLSARDGKHGYLGDLPRVLDYLVRECAPYAELAGFAQWLQTRIVPELEGALARYRTTLDGAARPVVQP